MRKTLKKISVIVIFVLVIGVILFISNQDVYLGAMNTVVYDYSNNESVFVIPVKLPKFYGSPNIIELFSSGEKIADAGVLHQGALAGSLSFKEKKKGLFYTYGILFATLSWEHDLKHEESYIIDSISLNYDNRNIYFFDDLNIHMKFFNNKESYEPGHITIKTMGGENLAVSVSSSQKTEIVGLGSLEKHLSDDVEFPIILSKDSSDEFKTDLKIDDSKFNVVGVYVDLTDGCLNMYQWWLPSDLAKAEYIKGSKK